MSCKTESRKKVCSSTKETDLRAGWTEDGVKNCIYIAYYMCKIKQSKKETKAVIFGHGSG